MTGGLCAYSCLLLSIRIIDLLERTVSNQQHKAESKHCFLSKLGTRQQKPLKATNQNLPVVPCLDWVISVSQG